MPNSTPDPNSVTPTPRSKRNLDPELYAQLKAEAKAPYRGLRQFLYFGFGASGFIGAFIFFFQILAGRELETALPNFALQVGVVALMVWLFRLDQASSSRNNKKS
jgi:Low psii accumulation1 / Rep27